MDRRVKKHRKIILAFMEEFIHERDFAKSEYQMITDDIHFHYQIICSGWRNGVYFHNILFHLQIKEDGKVWIMVNNTEILIAEVLLSLGISKNDLVIGFQPAELRKHTGFALA